ncbi:MAG: hypothetical protein COA94_00115 [Rickettsiales bacterium]|nr:MAG: hypothetical protein COA94_00115 [Rickettsiales bacterium]
MPTIDKKKNVILFIDDEKICHTLVELIIPNFTDFKLVGAFDGEGAIELAARYANSLCLVISDVILPDMTGYDIFKTLKQNDKFAKLPFIFQTGLGSQEEELKKNINEGVQILYKPYNQTDLLAAIDKACPKEER